MEDFICDPGLEAGRQVSDLGLDMEIWGHVTVDMKIWGPGKVIEDFNSRRLRQADLWVQGHPGTKQVLSKF